MDCSVFDNWSDKIVFSGSKQDCVKYLNGNNTYQANYSKLTLSRKSENKANFLKLVEKLGGEHDPTFMEEIEYRVKNRESIRAEQAKVLERLFKDRDKTKEYKTDYGTYSIVTFWKDETTSIQAGWMHKVINNK